MTGLRRRPEDEKVVDHIRKRLRRRRMAMGLTLEQMGKRCDLNFRQVGKYEHGENAISASRLWSLAKALEVEPGWFFEGLER